MDSLQTASDTLPISVSALNAMVRRLLDVNVPLLWVSGEISNFTRAASGHCYFVLKDAQAQVRCTLFRQRASFLDFMPKNGDQVEIRALATLYESRGEFQLNVESLRLGGVGRLFEAFERLKAKLDALGFFAQTRKRPLPKFARRVGVVTSPAAAALRDVLTTLRRRMPGLKVVLYPTPVQGAGAAQAIAQAIDAASERAECDVLVLCRGGGSIEDLWSFNEEVVAQAIVRCTIPVVSGVGHETDFTIADFVADARAPTPTAAAALVSQDRIEWQRRLKSLSAALQRQLEREVESRMQRVDALAHRLVHPGERLRAQTRQLLALHDRLQVALARQLERAHWAVRNNVQRWHAANPDLGSARSRLDKITALMSSQSAFQRAALRANLNRLHGKLDSLDPRNVLERGYSIVRNEVGDALTSSERLRIGEVLSIHFARGRADASLIAKE